MSDVLDLEPIKARLAATTPGEWRWQDEVSDIPYGADEVWWHGGEPVIPGNDGSLGITGLYIEIPIDDQSSQGIPILYADDENIPEDPDDSDGVDWSKWRGLIRAKNLADLTFISNAKTDIAALLAEVERLRAAGT